METKRILVVDDDPAVRDLVGAVLDSAEFEVHGAADGIEALERMRDATYDLCLIDLMMPRMGGLELLRAIRETDREMIVFIITGYASEESAREAEALGCRSYITKPFDIDEVTRLVRDALEARDRGFEGPHAGAH